MRVHEDQQIVVDQRPATLVLLVDRTPRQIDAEAAYERLAPFRVRHLAAVRIEPDDILDLRTDDPPALEKAAPVQQRVPLPDLSQALQESDQFLVLGAQAPVDPAQLVVLAIRVVVAALRAP